MRPPPRRREFGDAPIGEYLDALEEWLLASRVLFQPGSGIQFTETSGGIIPRGLAVEATEAGSQAFIVKTSGTITARSGASYGSGPATIQIDSGASLSDGDAIVVKNLIPSTIASGKYGLAWLIGERYFLIAEC